ncbi:MAG: hypothetical protein ACOCWQ_02155 [Nanoarchaeota archaeon]
MQKAQTSTEYLVVLAVVLILVIVITVLLIDAGVVHLPAHRQLSRSHLASYDVGILQHAISSSGATLRLLNNLPYAVQVTGVSFDGVSASFPELPLVLDSHQDAQLITTDITAQENEGYRYVMRINYTDPETALEMEVGDESYMIEGQGGYS